MNKNFFYSLLILLTGIMINVQANEDVQLSHLDRFIIQLKKTCHYEDNTIHADNKNIQVLKINSKILNGIYTYDNYESNTKNEIIFNNVKFKNKDKISFINIRLYNSKKEAIEALFANLAGYQSICSHQTQVRLLENDNSFEYGDYAVCIDDRVLSFSRANALIYIYCSKGSIDSSYHNLFKSLDELCCKQIQTEIVENNRFAIIVSTQNDNLNIATSIEAQKTQTTYKRKHGDDEKLEQKLKSMPKEDAQKHCLEKALELSETPDKNADKLLFYLCGLPMVEEDGTTRVLHRVSSTAKDRKLLEATMQLQGKWLSLYSEPRKVVLDDLSKKLKSDDRKLRRQALASLGRSGSLDALPQLLLELEEHPDDRDVLSAIGQILGWSEAEASLNEARVNVLKEQASELLKKLKFLWNFSFAPLK